MYNIIIDFETSGLNTATDRILEIGAMIVDENWEDVDRQSSLIAGVEFSEEISKLTRIYKEDIVREGITLDRAMLKLSQTVEHYRPTYVIAYNRQFDEAMFRHEMARGAFQLLPGINYLAQTPWICAMSDVEENYQFKCWKLSHLAVDRGVPVNPAGLHRAMGDVKLTRKFLQMTNTRASDMYAFQCIPWMYMQALIPAPWTDGGKGKAEAVKLGYSWERAKNDERIFEKSWVKKVKQHQIDGEITKSPFKVRTIA